MTNKYMSFIISWKIFVGINSINLLYKFIELFKLPKKGCKTNQEYEIISAFSK
jgi:hypothetical protein